MGPGHSNGFREPFRDSIVVGADEVAPLLFLDAEVVGQQIGMGQNLLTKAGDGEILA